MLSLLAALALTTDDPHQHWIPILSVGQSQQAPLVAVVDELSSADRTVVHVQLPGVLAHNVVVEGGKSFVRFELPGWSSKTAQLGAPELPVLRFALAVPPGTTQATRDDNEPGLQGVTVYLDTNDAAQLPQGLDPGQVYPVPEPAWDGDPDAGTPNGVSEVFHYDPAIYEGQALYPASNADSVVQVEPLLGGVEGVIVELRPFRWDPLLEKIEVLADFRVTFDHPDPLPGLTAEITPGTRHLVDQIALNFDELAFEYESATQAGDPSRMLMLGPSAYLDELLPLIEQRQLSGLDVEFLALEDLADTTPQTVRAAIGEWAKLASHSGYVLLVGDVDQVPLHPAIANGGLPGDAAYRRPLDDAPEVRASVGRLSVDDEADLATQVAKIVQYERGPASNGQRRQIGLAAHVHPDSSPSSPSYEGLASELDANLSKGAADLLPQLFLGSAGAAQASLEQALFDGLGFLLYRGQGSATAWPDWTIEGDDMSASSVKGLTNELQPLLWALAPSTADVSSEDSVGEAWMSAPGGAVSVLGAVGPTQVGQAHALARELVLLHGQGQATDTVTPLDALVVINDLNAHGSAGSIFDRLLLLGDPAMRARVDDGLDWQVDLPSELVLGEHGGTLEVRVQDANGGPLDGALVSLLIGSSAVDAAGKLVQAPFQVDAYTENGQASLLVDVDFASLQQLGAFDSGNFAQVYVSAPDGSSTHLSVGISAAGFEDLGGAVGNTLGHLPQLVCFDELEGGAVLEFEVDHSPAFTPGVLYLALQDNPVPYAGGFFHPLPVLLPFPFVTDAAGQVSVLVGPLPAVLPADLKLVLQGALFHASGSGGILLTNGVASKL